jgi:hypothetical protein
MNPPYAYLFLSFIDIASQIISQSPLPKGSTGNSDSTVLEATARGNG